VILSASAAVHTAGRNALVTTVIVCCGFVVCWSLNAILFFVNFLGHSVDFGGWLYHLSVVLVFTNSCINPFIFAAKYREFQQGVRSLMSKLNLNQQHTQVAAIT